MLNRNKNTILWFLPLAILLFNGACPFENKISVENALIRMREIREADLNFYRRHKKFGSLQDLSSNKFLPGELADGVDVNYRFELKPAGDTYTLNAIPLRDVGSCFFMDESGVIRASYSSQALANRSSEAIKKQ